MKKIFASMAIAAAMFAFVACSSPVEKAKAYSEDIAEAIKNGDMKKAAEIAEEAEEWMNTLTEEEKAEIAKALGAELDF